jgi:hypothetical protein
MSRQVQSGSVHRRTGWFKSSRSNPSQNCVEVRVDGQTAGIRDSKNVIGPVLACATASLAALVALVRRGDLDRTGCRTARPCLAGERCVCVDS